MSTDTDDMNWETNELDTQIMNHEGPYNALLVAAQDRDMTSRDAEELVESVKDQLSLTDDFDWSMVDYCDLAGYWNQGVS